MRKTTAAVLAVGSAFALTAAAAAAISVTGPFDPASGTGASFACDIGDTTVASASDGGVITSFTVTTSNDTTYVLDSDLVTNGDQTLNAGCENAYIWVRVDYTDETAIPTTTNSIYAKFPASGDYTDGGTDGPYQLNLALADGDWYDDTTLTQRVDALALDEEALLRTVVLVTTTTPANFVAPENVPA